jgi:hypothetical protein
VFHTHISFTYHQHYIILWLTLLNKTLPSLLQANICLHIEKTNCHMRLYHCLWIFYFSVITYVFDFYIAFILVFQVPTIIDPKTWVKNVAVKCLWIDQILYITKPYVLRGRQIQTFPDLCDSYVLECLVQIKYCARQKWVFVSTTILLNVHTRESSQNLNSNTESDWLQCDCLATHVIPQQYSLATFVSMCFHSHKEKWDVCLKNVIISSFIFKNCVSQGVSADNTTNTEV